ncbi:MAG: 30S ribosomal protein S14 [Flavobacteriales bacterium]|jgi:small subunit ribosomal protein S14|uniref:30S ribosomal protein S14 n=1 Tax=Blattabacterium sp. (Mastotermes darwiniensis) TaxID=39768 RepID=UPI000231DE66|nr:30S ribosomal protein S14 [Blattabacterium sp. (Mastotermes darwiniensis)]AER40666.1 30S ribosomal protein S14 [Blattabacterium sp. (Mastotermes darwiniensis) str. MADAR]MDR1804806.1 30S ribosomal protein S14 [Flavobacteriales bacterium]
MAKESVKARQKKREKIVLKYARKRKILKESKNYKLLQKLPRDASPVRLRNRCSITGRCRGYMRLFGISRIVFRNMVAQGLIPGVKKASW